MERTFEKFLAHLIDHDIRFILVGGLAVSLNGYVRLTEDVDILVDISEQNLKKLISALGTYGEGHGGKMELADFDDSPGALRVIEKTEACQIDIFTQISGLSYNDLAGEAEGFELDKKVFHYASKAQLIQIKEGSIRDKDKLDVSALRQLQNNPNAFD